jgi:hypothetical protein
MPILAFLVVLLLGGGLIWAVAACVGVKILF